VPFRYQSGEEIKKGVEMWQPAFEKAGFRVVREFGEPEDGQRHALVRRDRTAVD